MEIIAVSVGQPREVEHNGRNVTTAIFKAPVSEPRRLTELGVAGDLQGDPKNHGGPEMAVHAWPHEHYAYWGAELGRDDLTPGIFGENLTVTGMTEDKVQIGDVYVVGEAHLQVTQPRVPCYKLNIRLGDEGFLDRSLPVGKAGYYFKVLEEGEVIAGDRFRLEESTLDAPTVQAVYDARFSGEPDLDVLRRALAQPALGMKWRKPLEQLLEKYGD